MERLDMASRKWAVGYLRGQVNGYRGERVPIAMVASAAKIALDSDVPMAEIVSLLHAAGLTFDETTHELKIDAARRRPPRGT
jgi:hypothetical protein